MPSETWLVPIGWSHIYPKLMLVIETVFWSDLGSPKEYNMLWCLLQLDFRYSQVLVQLLIFCQQTFGKKERSGTGASHWMWIYQLMGEFGTDPYSFYSWKCWASSSNSKIPYSIQACASNSKITKSQDKIWRHLWVPSLKGQNFRQNALLLLESSTSGGYWRCREQYLVKN